MGFISIPKIPTPPIPRLPEIPKLPPSPLPDITGAGKWTLKQVDAG